MTAFAQSAVQLSPFLCIPRLANRSYSSGTAEVATKIVTSWSNALDAPNEDQCGLFDVGAPTNDQCGPLDAPNDNQCAPKESVVALPEAFELTEPVLVDFSRLCPEASTPNRKPLTLTESLSLKPLHRATP